MSHDLRSPLMAISIAAGTLRMTATDPVERELTETVLSETDRMSRLVSDLLDLSRLQAGAFERREDWCDVGDLVRAAVREAGRSGPPAVVSDAVAHLPLVRGDARQLERVLVNLIENGKKFSGDDRARRDRRPHERRPGRGVGARSRAGHPADRPGADLRAVLPRSLQRGLPGSGLGLAIVRGLAEANGAVVRIESRPGGGSVFTVSLPTSAAA